MGAEAWAAGAQVKLCVVVGAAGLVINTLLLRSLLAWLGKVRLLWLGAARGAHRVLQSHQQPQRTALAKCECPYGVLASTTAG